MKRLVIEVTTTSGGVRTGRIQVQTDREEGFQEYITSGLRLVSCMHPQLIGATLYVRGMSGRQNDFDIHPSFSLDNLRKAVREYNKSFGGDIYECIV